ncbi:MAG: hypothetical protein AAB075_02690 [Gemmatimonadota bacterium]
MTKSKMSAAVMLVAAAVVGGVIGAWGTDYLEHEGRQGPGHGGRDGYVERMTTELNLTTLQQDSIRAILERFEPGMDSLWRDLRPRFDSLRQVARSAIVAQLDSVQQRKYQAMLARRDSLYRERRSNGRK